MRWCAACARDITSAWEQKQTTCFIRVCIPRVCIPRNTRFHTSIYTTSIYYEYKYHETHVSYEYIYPVPFASRLPVRILRAHPTETKVESGTSQSKYGISVTVSNGGKHTAGRVGAAADDHHGLRFFPALDHPPLYSPLYGGVSGNGLVTCGV